ASTGWMRFRTASKDGWSMVPFRFYGRQNHFRTEANTQIMHRGRHWAAPEGHQIVTQGASRGLASYRSQAPAGAKQSRWEINCSALSFAPPGLIHGSALAHG